MTFEENIRSHWEATYAGCDPVHVDPRKYSLAWYTEGAFYGVKLGIQIGMDVKTEDEKRAWDARWELGYKQGLAYAAFNCSNVQISDQHSVEILAGAEIMRDRIVDLLHAAANGNDIRAEAKWREA